MKIGIIGAGASGMIAAIAAARNGNKVTVLERNTKPGKKLLSTGNGKCNYTNIKMGASYYNEESRALFDSVYNRFDYNKTLEFFNDIGVASYNKNGYIYPRSEQASSVANCLNFEMLRNKVDISYECSITNIEYNGQFLITTDKGGFVFDKLIIAAGSNAAPKTGSDGSGYGYAIKLGHTVKKPLPALCGLKCKGTDFKSISGVRCQAKVTLCSDGKEIKSDFGELQFTDYGISGIPVFQISGQALRLLDEGHAITVKIDFTNDYEYNELYEEIKSRFNSLRNDISSSFLEGFINSKLAEAFCKELDFSTKLTKEDCEANISKLINLLKKSEYTVTGHRGFDNCQVCTGGVVCSEVNENLMSKMVPGLYFAGEILDVDGICGGYNLQWAWSSGFVAGQLL